MAKIRAFPLLLALGALGACQPAGKAPEAPVTVEGAWVRLAPVPGNPGAAYFTLHSHKGSYTLESIASPEAERIELHDSGMEGGMMRMAPLAAPKLDEGATLTFEPGGKHAMLFGIRPDVAPGSTIRLSFVLSPNVRLEAQAQVVGAGDAGPPGHDHH